MSSEEDSDRSSDIYNLAYVRSYLERPAFLLTGQDLRVFSQMGDRVAAAILKVLFPNWPSDETMERRILAAVHASLNFSSALENSDRIPGVTFCLLRHMMATTEFQEHRDSISKLVESIRRAPGVGIPDTS
jgi:hypothetical protein